jgi:hypothetical protein
MTADEHSHWPTWLPTALCMHQIPKSLARIQLQGRVSTSQYILHTPDLFHDSKSTTKNVLLTTAATTAPDLPPAAPSILPNGQQRSLFQKQSFRNLKPNLTTHLCRSPYIVSLNSNGDKFNLKFLRKLWNGRQRISVGGCAVNSSRLRGGGGRQWQDFVNKAMSSPVPSEAKFFFLNC